MLDVLVLAWVLGTWSTNRTPAITPKPEAPINIAFTYQGLKALGLPMASLMGFPQEFIMGMKKRKAILGDDGPSDPEHWDKVWAEDQDVHVAISINGQKIEYVEE